MNSNTQGPERGYKYQLALAVSIFCVTTTSAHAYIDPGTGTMILQVVGAAIVGTLFYFRALKRKVIGWLTGRQAPDRAPNDSPNKQ